MTTEISLVQIQGNSIDLTDIEYEIFITHGRSSVFDGASPSSASLTLIAQGSTLPYVNVDDSVIIQAEGIDRFTGEITDISINHLIDGFAQINIQCIGMLAALGTQYGLVSFVGVDDPMTSKNRANLVNRGFVPVPRTLIDGGFDYIVEGFIDYLTASPNRLSWLTEIADWAGAAVIDTPSGDPYVQFYDSRRLATFYPRWIDESTLASNNGWNEVGGTVRWIDEFINYSTAETPLSLDPTKVVFAPSWTVQSGNIINRVNVEWVSGTVTQSSLATKVRELNLSTRMISAGYANSRANRILDNQDEPRYALGSVEILMDEITDTAVRDELLGLIAGRRIEVTNLPDPTPASTYVGVLEGWSETYFGLGGTKGSHRLTLSLSDPNYTNH